MGQIRIKGGRVFDGVNKVFQPNSELCYEVPASADREICLTEQDMILPGVIDMHIHVWTPYASKALSVPADRIYYKGVVAAADAGSFGCNTWHKSNQFLEDTVRMKVKMFMHLLPVGLTAFPFRNFTQVENVDLDRVIETARADQSGNLLGFKIHLGLMDVEHDVKLLKAARRCTDAVKKQLEIHVSNAKAPFETIAEYLRPGDIIAHAFSGFGDPILDDSGRVKQCVKDAVYAGVHLDVAHASKHFSWRVFRQARDEGILFDSIGTDTTAHNYENESKGMIDIFHIASGLMNAGVSEEHVVNALTYGPAAQIGYELDLSKQAVVLKRVNKTVPYYDDASQGLKDYIIGDHEYMPTLFIDRGRLIWDDPSYAK